MISIRLIKGAAALALLAVMACAGAMLAPGAYSRIGLAGRFAGPDMAHWLGRDELGRDTLGRLLAGATTTVGEALVVVAIALAAGLLLDLAHRASPRFGMAIVACARICFIAPKFLLLRSRLGDVAMAALSAALLLPGFLVVIAAVAYLGPGQASCVIALGLLFAVATAFVQGHDIGSGSAAMRRAALALRLFAWAMLSVSALDAIGLGTMPPAPSWGGMLGGLHGPASLRGPVILAGACLLLAATAALVVADVPRKRIGSST
jgi:ABC-type dipeptide/oligopeptide/nickel transport system permease subunit